MKQITLLVGLMAAFVVGSKLLIENVLGIALEPLVVDWMRGAGVGTAMAVILLLVADIALPIPSSVVMVLSGAAFGVAKGAAIALVGSIAGEWLGFEVVRRYGRAASRRLVSDEELLRFDALFRRHGAVAVVVTRALPVVMETMSLVAGLMHMRRRDFLGASLLGTAPIVVLYAWAGARSYDTGSLIPAAVILIATAGLGWLLYRVKLAPR